MFKKYIVPILFFIIILFYISNLFSQDSLEDLYFMQLFNGNTSAARKTSLAQMQKASSLLEFDWALYNSYATLFFENEETDLRVQLKKFRQKARLLDSHLYFSKLGVSKNKEKITSLFVKKQKATVTGPFYYNSKDDFFKTAIQTANINNSHGFAVTTYNAKTDNNVYIDLNQHFSAQEHCYFLLTITYNSSQDTLSSLLLGKTGYAQVFVNGKQTATIDTQHKFATRQYRIPVSLNKGSNTLVLKIADNTHFDRKVSLSIEPSSNSLIKNKHNKKSWDYYYSHANPNQLERLKLSFLYFKQGLYSGNNIAEQNLASIPKKSNLQNITYYYQSLISEHASNRLYLYNILNREKQSVFFLFHEALLFIGLDQNERALQTISLLKNRYPNSYFTSLAQFKLFSSLNWDFEVKKSAEQLKKIDPFTTKILVARNLLKSENYTKASIAYQKLLLKKPKNRLFMLGYCTSLKYSAYPELYRTALYTAVQHFPEDIEFKFLLAEHLYSYNQYEDALLVLSFLKNRVPINAQLNYLLSKNYLALNKHNLAYFYAKKIKVSDPANSTYQDYYTHNFHSQEYHADKLFKFNTIQLSKQAAKIDEPVITLFNEQIEEFDSDGSSIKRVRIVYRINSAKNNDLLKQISFTTNGKHDRVLSFKCEVINNAGSRSYNNLNKRSLSEPESRLYYDIMLWQLKLPELADNDLVSVDYIIENSSGRDLQGYIGGRYNFSRRYYTLQWRNLIITPASKPLYWKKNKLTEQIRQTKKNGQNYFLFIKSNSPSLIYEKSSEPFFNATASLIFSSLKTWNDFYKWYSLLLESRQTFSSEMESAYNSIITKDMNDEQKISAIYQFITDRIRYVGFEIGIGGIQPRHAHITYQSKLGDCKDIALLLSLFLKRAGFKSHLALIRTASAGVADFSIPYIGNFNHAICFVDYKGGIFLDGTVDKADIYDLPGNDRNTQTLLITEKGYQFKNTGSNFYSTNSDTIITKIKIASDGKANLIRSLEKRGDAATAFRNSYTNDRKKINDLSKYWNSVYPGSEVQNYLVENRTGLGTLKYSYSIEVPHYSKVENGYVILPLDPINYSLLRGAASSLKRYNGLFFNSSEITISSVLYTIPQDYSIESIPQTYSKIFNNIEYSLKISQPTPTTIKIDSTLKIARTVIQPDIYQKFRQELITITQKENQSIILKKRN